ncbi:uncharacterized protein [Apostichopus japonicus]|uniref:uncharacterized protein n=1 Tax=Stichopus japonicus TaxID=307972 RepID=UPI003AB8C9C0
MAVHHQHYRLPSSTLEKAKVAKLLMAVDSGKSSNFVGRTLDEISLDEIELTQVLEEEGETIEQNEKMDKMTSEIPEHSEQMCNRAKDAQPSTSKTERKPKNTSGIPRKWPEEDKDILTKHFKKYIKRGTLPGKDKILVCMENYPANFSGRTWKNIKDCIRNISSSLKLPSI